jgi:hypothetical protein
MSTMVEHIEAGTNSIGTFTPEEMTYLNGEDATPEILQDVDRAVQEQRIRASLGQVTAASEFNS